MTSKTSVALTYINVQILVADESAFLITLSFYALNDNYTHKWSNHHYLQEVKHVHAHRSHFIIPIGFAYY